MEEADNLLLVSLKTLGVKMNSLSEFTDETFITAIILCFDRISSMLQDADNFVDMKFLKRQNLKEATNRFKICNKFVEYLKVLGYFHDLSFNAFLYPNIKDTRLLLGFLFEYIFKSEDDSGASKQARPTNEMETLVRRRFAGWQKKPWILPDFLKDQKRKMLIGGDVISVPADIDFDRVAGSKSKKVKGLYQRMKQDLSITDTIDAYQRGAHMLGMNIQKAAWSRGQGVLGFQRRDVLGADDEEDTSAQTGASSAAQGLVKQDAILSNFSAAVQSSQQNSQGSVQIALPSTSGSKGPGAQEKTIKEVLEEREEQLKDLEQLQDIKQSAFIDALADDMEKDTKQQNKTVTPAIITATAATVATAGEQEAPSKQSSTADDLQDQIKSKFNVEKLREDKEAEISVFTEQLDTFKQEIGSNQIKLEQSQTQKTSLEEEKKEMADNLKKQTKANKKKKEVLNELEKLGGQDLRVLQAEVGEINEQLEQLKEEWEGYKKPINEEIFEAKQEIADKRVEYKYKNDKIKGLKQELKGTVAEIEHKKKVLQFIQQEWEQMPKDVNRNQFIKRINEITGNLKGQNGEIRKILEEVRGIQDSTTDLIKSIKAVDVDVEERVFNDAKKDKIAKEIYKEIQTLKNDFDVLISSGQEENKLKTQIRDIETKMDDFRIKYKNMAEINKLKEELQGVVGENAQLQAKLGSK